MILSIKIEMNLNFKSSFNRMEKVRYTKKDCNSDFQKYIHNIISKNKKLSLHLIYYFNTSLEGIVIALAILTLPY